MEPRGEKRRSESDPFPRHRLPYMIDRRIFMAGAAATLVAAPSARAQQQSAPVRLAIITGAYPVEEMTETGAPRFRALLGELRRLGLVEGENLIVVRWSNAGRTRSELQDLANRMVASQPDVILTTGTMAEAKAATATIPIVSVGGDPITSGLVESLARPGGNVTGFTQDTGPEFRLKLIQLLREAVPGAEPVAWLVNRRGYETNPVAAAMREVAPRLGITLLPALIEDPVDEQSIARAFAALPEWPNRVMYVNQGVRVTRSIRTVAAEALKARIPAVYHLRAAPDAGLLMSYGRDINAQYADAAGYVVRIARGENPAEMPVQQPSKWEFVVNLRTAKALGITIPPAIMIQATEFIE